MGIVLRVYSNGYELERCNGTAFLSVTEFGLSVSVTELGLSQNDLKLISMKTVTDGMKTYIAHRRGTHRRPVYEVHRL